MRALLGCTAVVLAFSFTQAADDKKDEKIDPAKLVGEWEDTDSKKGDKDLIRFTKGDKVEFIKLLNGKGAAVAGKYKVEGNKLTLDFGGKDDAHVLTISKLTDGELSLVDDKKKSKSYKKLKDE